MLPDALKGVSQVVRPHHFGVANAIGAAIAQISGQMERVFFFDEISREGALEFAKTSAVDEAIRAGAEPASVEIVDAEEVPLAYIGKDSRIRLKAAGSLAE